MKITYSPQRNDDGEHDGTYIMSATGLGSIGTTTKFEGPTGQTIKFAFEPNSSFSHRLTECEARTMLQLKAKILKQLL